MAGQGTEGVFYGGHVGVSLRERRAAVGRHDEGHIGGDHGFAVEVDALEFDAVIGVGGEEGDRDVFAGVEADTGEGDGAGQGVLSHKWRRR